MSNLLSCGLALMMLAAWVEGASAAEPAVGSDAPAFKMTGSDGKPYSLADFKGKKAVVIAWFPKAFTGGCTKECKSMREFGKDLQAYNVAYFTASCDTVEDNKKFAESLGLDYPILCDPSKENAKMFGVSDGMKMATRWTFYIGKDGKVLAVDKSVNTANHGKDIADKLGELKVEKKK